MLCQQLTLSLGLLLVVSHGFASDAETRMRDLDNAGATAAKHQEEAAQAVNEASELLGRDSSVRQEMLVISQGFASDAKTRMRDLDSADATASKHQEDASQAVKEASELLGTDSSVRKEMQQVLNLNPAPLVSIDDVSGTEPGIDLDALMARYNPLDSALSPATSGEQLLIFISASMPRESLRKLARQAALTNAPLILRGVVDGDFPATAKFMRDILGEEEPQARAMIDPTLFDRFGVKQVPAMVLIPSGACVAGARACPQVTPTHIHIAGDVTLDYALDYIARTHPESRTIADSLHARLEGTP